MNLNTESCNVLLLKLSGQMALDKGGLYSCQSLGPDISAPLVSECRQRSSGATASEPEPG